MGFKRYLLWNDAIYGHSSNWLNINYYVSKNRIMVASLSLWTVEIISLI